MASAAGPKREAFEADVRPNRGTRFPERDLWPMGRDARAVRRPGPRHCRRRGHVLDGRVPARITRALAPRLFGRAVECSGRPWRTVAYDRDGNGRRGSDADREAHRSDRVEDAPRSPVVLRSGTWVS